MKKCFVVRTIASIYQPEPEEYLISDHIIGVVETKEEAVKIAKDFPLPNAFPRDFHVYILVMDFPFGGRSGDEFDSETVFYRFDKGSLVELDWRNLDDEDEELNSIYLLFANQVR